MHIDRAQQTSEVTQLAVALGGWGGNHRGCLVRHRRHRGGRRVHPPGRRGSTSSGETGAKDSLPDAPQPPLFSEFFVDDLLRGARRGVKREGRSMVPTEKSQRWEE